MRLVFDTASYLLNKKFIDSFGNLYKKGFPDENEREEFEIIIKRVTGEKKKVEPNTLILLNDSNGEITGGLIADWYKKSRSVHLIYLIIEEKQRGKGMAKAMINAGVPQIIDLIKKGYGIEIKNVFFESNNPVKTVKDNFDPVKRLQIFSKLGAKKIDLPYIQPALDNQKNKVSNLFLLSFPQFNINGSKIPVREIVSFLEDLYAGLEVPDIKHNADFLMMENHLNISKDNKDYIELTDIPC